MAACQSARTLHRSHAISAHTDVDACAACTYGAGAFTAPTGAIAIPIGGTAVYANNVVCEYRIATGAPIYLRFYSFATESGYDTVEVYDGTSDTGALKGSFSGTAIPPVQSATSGSMFIRFTSGSTNVAAGVAMAWLDTMPVTLAPTTASPTTVTQSNWADPAGTAVPCS